jgi:hypothetical protein
MITLARLLWNTLFVTKVYASNAPKQKLQLACNNIDIISILQKERERERSTTEEKEQKNLEHIRNYRVERNKYRKLVKFEEVLDEIIKTNDPEAKMNCEILRASPVKVPGVPKKFNIFRSGREGWGPVGGRERI